MIGGGNKNNPLPKGWESTRGYGDVMFRMINIR